MTEANLAPRSGLKYEPVRVMAYVTGVLSFLLGILEEVSTDWDGAGGWLGLGTAVVLALAAEVTRQHTRSKNYLVETGKIQSDV